MMVVVGIKSATSHTKAVHPTEGDQSHLVSSVLSELRTVMYQLQLVPAMIQIHASHRFSETLIGLENGGTVEVDDASRVIR